MGPTFTMNRYIATREMVGQGVATSGHSSVFGSEMKTVDINIKVGREVSVTIVKWEGR